MEGYGLRKKSLRKYIALLTAFVFILGSVGMAFADTVYVGNVGFDMDKMVNDDTYNEGFNDYFATHTNDPFIVDMAGMTFDVAAYLNAPDGTSMPDFAASDPAEVPAEAIVWDGEGEPGEPVEKLTVENVEAINANQISVKFEGMEEAVTIDLDEALVEGENEITFTYKDQEFTTTVTYEAPTGLAVKSVSAIDDINVEFGGTYELPATVEITLSDETVVEVPVAWEDTVDVKAAGTYALEGALDLSELEDVAATDKVATVNVIVAAAVPETLTTDADAVIDAVVGDNVTITYTVKDKNGYAVEGTDVRVRVTDTTSWPNVVAKEQVLTTDENGQVTFEYTSTDGRDDDIQAVVLAKPTLRNTTVTVKWVETTAKVTVESPEAKGFIVDGATNIDPELMTVKYVATFKDENGNPLADGKVVSVDLTGVTGTLTAGADNEFDSSGTLTGGSINEATLANGDGTAVLEFTTDTAEVIEPLFYYDVNDNGLDQADPRAKGAKVEVLDANTQEPTLTLELKDVDEDASVNTDVTEVDGKLQVYVGSTVEYLLTAVDQYGNPFIGTVELSHKNLLDDLAGNDLLHGAIVFDTDDVDGGYSNTDEINIDFDTIDVDADGVVELQVSTGTAGNYTTLVVWVDADADGKLGKTEENIESQTIEFVAAPVPVLTGMEIEADLTTVVADGTNTVEYTVELQDQDGSGLDVSGASVDVVIELYKDGKKVDQSAVGASKITATGTIDEGTYAATGKNVKITSIDANDGLFDFVVTPVAADAGSSFYPVVYVDINGNGTIESDEIDTATEGPAFEATAEPGSYKLTLSKTTLTAGEDLEITITALDATPKTEVNFNGEYVVSVLLAADTSDDSAPAKTYLRTADFVKGVAKVMVPVKLVDNTDIMVSIEVNGSSVDVDYGSSGVDGDLTITAAALSIFALTGDDTAKTLDIQLQDQYGNDINTFVGAKMVKVTYPAAADTTGAGIDSEGNANLTFTSGAATITFGGNLVSGTYTVVYGSYTGTLTVEQYNTSKRTQPVTVLMCREHRGTVLLCSS